MHMHFLFASNLMWSCSFMARLPEAEFWERMNSSPRTIICLPTEGGRCERHLADFRAS
jgi:hypothetical protein